MFRAEGMTLRDVIRQLRERLQEPARQATLLGTATLLLGRGHPAPTDRDLSDATGAVVKSLQEHGRSYEQAAYNGCVALATLSQYKLADGSKPLQKASVEVTLATMGAFPQNAVLQANACAIIFNLCGAFSPAELIAAGGAVDALAAVLLSAGKNMERTSVTWQITRRNASRALAECCIGSPAIAERANQLGAASAILAALRAHPADAAVHCRTLTLLANGDPRTTLALVSDGAVEAIAEAIRAKPSDAALQYCGLLVLTVLIQARGGDGRQRASDAGAAELALAALREEGRMRFSCEPVDLQQTRDIVRVYALLIICDLHAKGEAVARAVTEAMVAHPENEKTQGCACVILDRIAHLRQEREAAIAAGAPEAIVRALRRFPELGDAEARAVGWRALAGMSTTTACLQPAVTAGGVGVACNGLRRHLSKGVESITDDVVKSLAGLLLASDKRGDKAAACAGKRRIVAAGCVELLVSAVRNHPNNENIAFSAAVALGVLSAEEPACADRVAGAGGVVVACSALRRDRGNPRRVELCATAISNISSSSLTGAALAREAGALELLAEAVKSFTEKEGVQRNCTAAIRSVVRNDHESMRRAKEMGFEFAEEDDSAAAPTACSAGLAPPLGSVETAAAQPAAATVPAGDDGARAEAPPPASTSAAARPPGGGAEQRSPPPRRACHNCGTQVGGSDPLGQPVQKLSACGGCRAVRYCSVACSREAWPSHKVACRQKQAESAAAKGTSTSANARDGQ